MLGGLVTTDPPPAGRGFTGQASIPHARAAATDRWFGPLGDPGPATLVIVGMRASAQLVTNRAL
jgi:hypothetical protein